MSQHITRAPLIMRSFASLASLKQKIACHPHKNVIQTCLWQCTKANKSTGSVLSRSTLLLQDGLDIQELPLVIRQMTVSEFPFNKAMYTGDEIIKATEQEEMFSHRLEACASVRHVFKLLEVPGDQVTAYSAAFALQRLCQLQAAGAENVSSFLKKAIFNELCETVVRDIEKLSNDTLISIVQCYLQSVAYEEKYIDLIDCEVEKRIGDGKFTLSELCSLVELLSTNIHGDQTLVKNIWFHIGNRYQDIDEKTLSTVYAKLKYKSPEHKYLLRLLDKIFSKCWWKLEAEEIAKIMQTLAVENHYNVQTLMSVGKWLFLNIHKVDDVQLKTILGAYSHLNFSDSNLMKALERYIGVKASRMNKTVTAMAMEYCRKKRFLSPKIFNAVATDFADNGEKYDDMDILYSLRPFGQLNYCPSNAGRMFKKVEEVLLDRFSHFDPATLVELLASFVYIQRYPVNFVDKVFTPHFLTKIRGMSDESNKQQAARHLLEIQAAMTLESPHVLPTYMVTDAISMSLTWREGRYFKFHLELGKYLQKLLGPDRLKDVEIPRGTPHLIDFEVCVSSHRQALLAGSGNASTRLAILAVMPEHYCVNYSHLMGTHAMKRRHLELNGYTVIEMRYEDFTWKHNSPEAKQEYLTSMLIPYLDIQELLP